jgi:3-oxoacyl-[acyl-carrier-protein] synthase III
VEFKGDVVMSEQLYSNKRINARYYSKAIELANAGEMGRMNGANVFELVCREMRDEYEAKIAELETQPADVSNSIPKIQETAYHHGYIAGQ